jgi:hypothetical protein
MTLTVSHALLHRKLPTDEAQSENILNNGHYFRQSLQIVDRYLEKFTSRLRFHPISSNTDNRRG